MKVRVFKCECDGNKFKKAGMPSETPTLAEKREIGSLISLGCTVLNMTVDEFHLGGWDYCNKKHTNGVKKVIAV